MMMTQCCGAPNLPAPVDMVRLAESLYWVGRANRVSEASNGLCSTMDWRSSGVGAQRGDHRSCVRPYGVRLDPEHDPGSGKFPVAGSLDLSPDHLELLCLSVVGR